MITFALRALVPVNLAVREENMHHLFFAACGLAIFSAVAKAEPIEVKPPQQKSLSTTQGRFVFGQISEYRRDQYVFDTATGRLWQKVCAQSDSGKSTQDDCIAVLQAIPYIGTDDKWYATPK